jgi:hypothetical protein
MIRKITKIKDKAFSSNQLAMSVVPINEFTHTRINAAIKLNNQPFFLNGVLSFDIAIVKFIIGFSVVGRIGNRCLLKKHWNRGTNYPG